MITPFTLVNIAGTRYIRASRALGKGEEGSSGNGDGN